MARSRWTGKFLTVVRALLCALLIVFYLKQARNLLFFGILLSAGLALVRLPSEKIFRDPMIEPFLERIFSLTCLFLLILIGACPPFYLALLITVSLVQGVVSVYFQWNQLPLPPNPSHLILRLRHFQWVWIAICTMLVQLQSHHPEISAALSILESVGYIALAALHAYVFYLSSLQLQPYLFPDLRKITATRR